ncbi:hypothetical protein KDA_75710 [Dictyobacter alpinus]|uniref:FtsK domain-containing protein n=1 Tax=Dictyobacter alpinus TaxID=2014873 RepID=A0A402BL47_9CHLR|nr:DNA translocase FtsK [Dictyobacter alpinus]GCE32087.1 hypothetical protein KDA_75710 [Dictyobacter alpinus]
MTDPGDVTADSVDETAIPIVEENETDTPGTQPKPFSPAEKAWGAVLYQYQSGKFWTAHALRYPPKEGNLIQQALALALIPDGSGQLMADRRAKRLQFFIEALQPSERSSYAEQARLQFEEWRAVREEPSPSEEQLVVEVQKTAPPIEVSPPGVSPEPRVLRPWKLPETLILPSSGEEKPEEIARVIARLKQESDQRAQLLQETLDSFDVKVEVRPEDICIGPSVVRYAIRPTGIPATRTDEHDKSKKVVIRDGKGNITYKKRTKVKQIMAMQNDIALWLEAQSMRMEAPVPGRPYVGVEIPIKDPRKVTFNEILRTKEYTVLCQKTRLPVALGWDLTNRVWAVDIRKMPHLLVAGSTGAGKSVFLKSLIAGIIRYNTPDDVRIALVDPKMVELGKFKGIPHLLSPIVDDMEKVVPLLKNAVEEMQRRYKSFSELGVTELEEYQSLRKERIAQGDFSLPNLPAILIVIDELAQLMITAPDETESYITQLTQLARATGIHLVLATQRPSVDVITGVIKNNLRTRIAFKVSSAIDSRTILDKGGAEKLNGSGDMLYMAEDNSNPVRIQAPFIANIVVEALVQYWVGENIRHATGDEDGNTLLEPEQLFQSMLWELEPIEGSKAPPRPKRDVTFTEEQLYEHLTSYLLNDIIHVNGTVLRGTPIPIPLKNLSPEDRLLVAEAVTWRGHRGSAETLNKKLSTKKGSELRDALVTRGLMDRETQQPIRPSERLAPLLIECGIIDPETYERIDTSNEDEEGEDEESSEAPEVTDTSAGEEEEEVRT